MIFQSDGELKGALDRWQARLRLSDWEIKARIVRAVAMARPDANAEVAVYLKAKRATITLCHPEDYAIRNDGLWPYDMERYLVHELLHVPMKAFAPDSEDEPDKHILMEQFIESMASALVVSSEPPT